MLTAHVIDRLVHSSDAHRLVASLASNGMVCPLPLRARLAHPAAAHSLALRRLVQLTYGPTETSRQLIADLLDRQGPDGSYEGSCDRDPLATAAVASAFGALLADHATLDPAVLVGTRDRAMNALAGMQQADGLFAGIDDRTEQDRQLTSAFILFLLGHDEVFRTAVRFADLMNYFDEQHRRLDTDTLELLEMSCSPPELVPHQFAA